jgi:hypothetical protein
VKPPDQGSLFDRPRRSRWPLVAVVVVILLALVVAWALGFLEPLFSRAL